MQPYHQPSSSQQATTDHCGQRASGIWVPHHYAQSASPAAPTKRNIPLIWLRQQVGGKTLWDWLSLLLIPLFIGVGTIWVTNRQTDAQNALSTQLHQSDQAQHLQDEKIAQQTRWDDLLKQYRDGIDDLLLHDGLRHAHPGDDVSKIAHARTLDILHAVDSSRRGLVIRYLSNLNLIQGGFFDTQGVWRSQKMTISLTGADLQGADLQAANLQGADLQGANLNQAVLRGANLDGAVLRDAVLRGADLGRVHLTGTRLNNVSLGGTILTEAHLDKVEFDEVDLSHANLDRAFLTEAQLDKVNLSLTNLDGTDLSKAQLDKVNLTMAILTPDQLHGTLSLSDVVLPNGFHCKEVSTTDLLNTKKQAENRDACLALYGKTG